MRRWFYSLMLVFPLVVMADAGRVSQLLAQESTPERFWFCHGGGCAIADPVSLDQDEWLEVASLFDPAPLDAAEERYQLGLAIALIERMVGEKTGTDSDLGGTFEGFGLAGQLDCIDESTNTTNYLKMLHDSGFLGFHEVAGTRTRGYFFHGWPHTSASIREQDNGQIFVFDSWFYDNGVPPVIIPLQQWQDGWVPPNPAALPPMVEDVGND